MELSRVIGELSEQARAPLYQQLHRALRTAIKEKRLESESALPPERDIAAEFGVSRITVRKALDALAAEGFIRRRHGAGTFVSARVEKSFSMLSSFTEDMASRGWTACSTWLRRSAGTASPEETMVLGLSPGSPVYRFHRIRFADDIPMALEYSSIPGQYLESADAVDTSLYAALEQTGSRPVRALQRLSAMLFTRDQAELLKIEVGEPGLLIERRGFLADGQAVEFTQSFYRGDSYDFVAELQVGTSG